ncbi:uncharacterized protein B0I36DRAFT_276992 [Microdochium trichocladiopsis]|uniref:PRISE-like Rossmann-fold domain-containing protein n=1 Tax=Microdochium trichocladiopsis TaxID=1682393 RepID=A0A9P9BJU2_9PEZI|nr:uncharacterized protein B0I36DRAFT_276992 [Microdochium trichocladiopsis]KAH7018435.1 hypothetical protein B0I36DRAFT_276992 [Microdochium trichocladiopsis]
MPGNHALVFGASGITGWAITRLILEGYPTADTFDSVTALTNRPLTAQDAMWPDSPKLQIVSGVDILTSKGQDGLEAELKERVKHASQITHVYFFAYIMDPDGKKECEINVELIKRAVSSVENISSNLKFVVLPTGTKAYGVHLIDQFPFSKDLPLKESLPRIPEPYASEMFYYSQMDMLAEMSKGKAWTWCDVIPDVIVGFVPNNNIYCLAQALATYLSLYAAVNGRGAEVQFPGTEQSYKILCNDSSQDIVAKTSILASLRPEISSGQRFNAADNAQPSSWSVKWPIICEYFGLKGVGPPPGGSGPQPTQYCADHFAEWQELEKKHGLKTGRAGNDRSFGGFPYFIMTMFNFDRHLDMSKAHALMGKEKEETDAKGAWWTAFDRFRAAKIIP